MIINHFHTKLISKFPTCFNSMDSSIKASHAPSDSMDLLSRAWCDTAIQVLQPAVHDTSTTVLEDNLIKIFENDMKAPLPTMNAVDGDLKPLPRWKSDDLKSWIWLQKAIHPELNYDRCFRKKWSLPSPWKLIPFKEISIKKWIVEMKRKRKDEERLQRAEMHAAISVAGVAAALAAVAAENVKANKSNSTKEAAVASAAALVASQCVQAAEDMGANHKELSKAVSSAMAATNACDILTLTAAAATSLRGAATLRARPGRKEKDGCGPILPLEETKDFDFDFDFGKYRTFLATGAELTVRSSEGKCRLRLVSVILNGEAKVILKIRNINILKGFASTKESIVTDIREDQIVDAEAAGSIVLTTSRGTSIKLEINDYTQYKIWFVTINHMLMLSTTFSGYELHFYRN